VPTQFRLLHLRGPHPNGLVTSLSGRVVERTYPHEGSWLEDCCTPEERATFERRKMELEKTHL
jgi:hypothetical protein